MPAIQYWFTGGALAAFVAVLATISTLGFSWYRAAVTEMESANSRLASEVHRLKSEQVKGLLGKVMTSGLALLKELNSKDEDQADHEAATWGTNARDLIAAAYGDGEAILFFSDSGYTFFSDGSGKSKIRNWIDGRMRRITELLPRTDTLGIRETFDPAKFNR